MQKTSSLFAIGLSLIFVGDHALSETPGTLDAEALLNLAPRISLEEKTISTFEIKGTFSVNGVQLRFMVSGKQPDQLELRVLDPRDETPVMVGHGDSFMLYDPVSSDVTIGGATPMELTADQCLAVYTEAQKVGFFKLEQTYSPDEVEDGGTASSVSISADDITKTVSLYNKKVPEIDKLMMLINALMK